MLASFHKIALKIALSAIVLQGHLAVNPYSA